MNRQFKRSVLIAASVLALSAMAPVHAAQGNGNVEFISGGVSLDARQAMLAKVGSYNMHLEFAAAPEGEYLSEVEVSVTDGRGQNVLQTRTDGPWLFARLPAGNYTVTAKAAGTTRTTQIAVGAGRRHLVMRFPALDKVAGAEPTR